MVNQVRVRLPLENDPSYIHQKEKGWGWITRAKFFNMLAGSDQLYNQLKAGMSEGQIRRTWQADLERFKEIRKQFAIYEINE